MPKPQKPHPPDLVPPMRAGRTEFTVLAGRAEGDLLNSGAAVLVVPADTGFIMRGNLARKIRAQGGDEIAARLRQYKPLVPGDVIMTDAGRLPAHKICHAVLTSWTKSKKSKAAWPLVLQAIIWRIVSRCVELAQLTGEASLAFPSLGTGAGKADRFETYSTMAAACLDSLRPDSSLRRVLFCFNKPETADIFRLAFLQQRLIRQARGLSGGDEAERAALDANLERLWPALAGLRVNVDKLAALVTALETTPSTQVANCYINNIINSTGVVIGNHAQAIVGTDGQKNQEAGNSHMAQKAQRKTRQSGGVNIRGPAKVSRDLVGRDKVTQNIPAVNITNSTGIAIGHRTRATVTQTSGAPMDEIARAFALIMKPVSALPEGPDRQAAQSAVEGLKIEAAKGAAAKEKNVRKWLDFLAATSAGAWEVAVNTFANPIAGLNTVFKKIAERAKEEQAP